MAKRLPRSRTLKGDPKLAYYDAGGGKANEPPIVLLHDRTFRSEDWENIFPRLATRYRVIAYDQRGHGKSGRASAYWLAEFVADALRVLREVAKAPSVLIGHSLGGLVALVVASQEPALVRGLVLEDPPYGLHGQAWPRARFGPLRDALLATGDPAAFRATVARLPLPRPGPRGERTIGEVRGFYAVERMVTYYGALDPAMLELRMSGPDSAAAAALEAAPSRVTSPLLLLVADVAQGGALPPEDAQQLAGRFPDAQLVRFPGVGHRIHGLRPEPFLEAIEPFLRRIRTTA